MTPKIRAGAPTIGDYQKSFSRKIKDYQQHTSIKSSTTAHPLISIITVVFNGGETLQRTIDSVKKQTYKNIEYMIIDGGSTDNTLEVVEANSEYVSFWVSEKDGGIYDAMNKGISIAKGDIIGIINADDYYEPDAVEQVVRAYNENGGDILHGDIKYIRNDKVLFCLKPVVHLTKWSFKRMPVNHPSAFITKAAYENIGLYDKSFKIAGDWDFCLRAFLQNRKFVYIPTTIASFTLEGVSIKQAEKGIREIYETLRERQLFKRPVLEGLFYFELLKVTVKKQESNVVVHTILSVIRKFKKRTVV
jgi:GT2 family glycosyltransferase